MDACVIDKLRDLVIRQHYAKNRYYDRHTAPALDPADVERQVLTYISQEITVADLTKCVEGLENESNERVKEERKRAEAREQRERILRVCEAALTDKQTVYGKWYGSRAYNLENDVATIRRELEDA